MKIYRKFITTMFLAITMACMLPTSLFAQSGDETLIEFFSDKATMEDDPKQGVYNITIFSPDNKWKVQLNYHADHMFGSFTNADFRLDSDGGNYNYARNPNNDMVFYSFKDMNVTVTDEYTCYRVKANCLTKTNMRFVIEATIDVPQPESTITDDLGYARIVKNSFFGSYNIKAENDRYKLAYGIVSDDVIGTFYRADMLMPELQDKVAKKEIKIISATAVHVQDGDNVNLKIEALSEDRVLYSLTMYNGPHEVEVTEERYITITDMSLENLTEMYGCYQFGGQNDEYAVAIAVTPEVLESGKTEWTAEDIFLPYTNILNIPDQEFVDIFDAKASLSIDDSQIAINADITSMDGVLYHVTMSMLKGGDNPPPVTETVNIDFGENVVMLDYSQGLGTIGLGAVKPGKYQLRCYLNAYELNGDFSNEEFIIDKCDVMVVNNDNTYVFHDGKYATASVDVVDGVANITIDMVCVDDVLYHATMKLNPMKCMKDMTIPVDMDDEILMVAIQEGYDTDGAEYTLQFQDMENVYDDDYNIVGEGYAVSFYFRNNGQASVGGEYGYSAGTLADDEIHTFFENGCEVRVGPVAGTLSLEPLEQVAVNIGPDQVNTYIYKVKFQFLGQNGAIYTGEGKNYLLCLDPNEEWLNMDESGYTGINDVLEKQGYHVRKVLKDGKLIIEKLGKEYDVQGRKVK